MSKSTEIAVVTGAASGIGRSIAEALLERGYRVVGVDVDEVSLRETAVDLSDGFIPVVGDIALWETHREAADRACRSGHLSAWVNNAGVDIAGAAHELTATEIEAGVRVLQLGPMYGTAVAVQAMLAGRHGSIVNVSSIQAIRSFPRHFVYQAAKAALLMVTTSVAVEYAPFGIRCNAVLPGAIETPMFVDTAALEGAELNERLQRAAQISPMSRLGQPTEVAEVVAFLLSDKASFVSGALLTIDGATTGRVFGFPPIDVSDSAFP